jgi:hypothetical protein
MASDNEHAIIEAVKALVQRAEALPVGPEKAQLLAAVEDLRTKLGVVGYHGV